MCRLEFFLDAICLHNASLRYVNIIIAIFDSTGISVQNPELLIREKLAVLEKHYSRFLPDFYELVELRGKYPPLANSRVIRTYLKLRSAVLKPLGKK